MGTCFMANQTSLYPGITPAISPSLVTPAEAGVQLWESAKRSWIPAFAEMTMRE
jgi:hypothetical protein